jgi:hypothetical protein
VALSLAALLAGVGVASRPAAQAADPWSASLHRPLTIPRRAVRRFAKGQGRGPVYPVGAVGGLKFLYPVQRSQEWYPSKWSGNKVAWFAAARFRGSVLIRARAT